MKLVKDTENLEKKKQQISDERAEEAIRTIIQCSFRLNFQNQ